MIWISYLLGVLDLLSGGSVLDQVRIIEVLDGSGRIFLFYI